MHVIKLLNLLKINWCQYMNIVLFWNWGKYYFRHAEKCQAWLHFVIWQRCSQFDKRLVRQFRRLIPPLSLFRLFTISPFNSTSFTLFLRQFSVARFVVNIDTIIVSTFDRLLLKLALVLEEHFKLRDGNGLNRFQLIPRDTDLPDDSG